MTEVGAVDLPPANPRRPRSMTFRKRRKGPPPTPGESRRQSDLIQSAWRHFREAAPMIAFLNTPHASLDGQPLQLASESDEGLERVERLLRQLTPEG